MKFCSSRGLEVYRRVIGGGAVYFDDEQLFYQLVAHEGSPQIPKTVECLFKVMIMAVVNAYRGLGVEAEYKPLNDVIVHGRKIAGTGLEDLARQ